MASESDPEPAADAPRIMQILALPDGRIAALSPEKGGLYVSEPGGRKWRKWPDVPEVFIHHLALSPDRVLYLTTPGGLLRWEGVDRTWEQVAEGSVSRIFFGPPGTDSLSDSVSATALFKLWGQGIFGGPAQALSATRIQAERAAREKTGADRAALQQKVDELGREMRALASPDESRELSSEEAREQLEALGRESEGNPWVSLSQGLPDDPVQSALLRAGDDWFAATFGRGVFRSRSAGASWEPASQGLASPWVLTLAVSPWGELYAGTYGGGLYRWNDETALWSMADPLFAGTDVQELAFGQGGEVLAASAGRGLFLSLDHGRSWHRVDADLPGADAQSVAVGTDGSLWVGFWDQGLFVSNDRGASWRPRPFAYVVHVADLAFSRDGVGYAVLAGLGLFRTLDGGRQWTPLRIPVRPARDLRLAVTADGRLFLGSLREGLWTSGSRGETWDRNVDGLTGEGVRAVVVSPAGAVLAIPSDASGLYERSESGQWRLLPLIDEDGLPYSVWEIIFLPDGRGVAAGYMEMLLSEDGGKTWQRKHFGQPFRALAVDVSGTIYSQRMMNTFALRRGTDKWEEAPDIPRDAYRFFRALGQGRWVAARQEIGVDFLLGEGVSLAVADRGLMNRHVLSLDVAPDGAVFAGLQDGMMVTRDRGKSWQPVVVVQE
ncbi:hypothetical protein [Desulfonatronum lacustre]|uniref:hypothetical protein n=1 Tax=Desulfonatronum lacustre TaxID=66849 RepID=UPI0012EC7398|nr:hypothetical protein [Desulfonatronum lacustre]